MSLRTVYQDMQTLIALGAPIDGAAGVGYLLRPGFFLPPLMFNVEELEALTLGARWVKGQGDTVLAQAADTALAKIGAASPKDLRQEIAEIGLWARRFGEPARHTATLHKIREAIRREHKLTIRYTSVAGSETERVVWPVALGFFEGVQLIAAWCELRKDFRHFRVDHITSMEALGISYPRTRRELARLWKQTLASERARPDKKDPADRS